MGRAHFNLPITPRALSYSGNSQNLEKVSQKVLYKDYITMQEYFIKCLWFILKEIWAQPRSQNEVDLCLINKWLMTIWQYNMRALHICRMTDFLHNAFIQTNILFIFTVYNSKILETQITRYVQHVMYL